METTETTTTAAGDEQEKVSLWEDFIDIYFSPQEVFARRADGGRWGLPLLLVMVLMVVLYFASQSVLGPVVEQELTRAMEGNTEVTTAQMEQAREMASTFGLIGFVVTYPISILLAGVLLWGIGKLFDSVATVGGAVLIATYAQFPRLLQQALYLLQGLVLDVDSMESIQGLSIGPARFLDPDAVSPVVLGLVGRLDVFILWGTVLLAIGLHQIGRVPRAQAYFAAALVWGLAGLPILMGSLMGGG
ncbi:MAG: hypothetical protein GEU90_12535 [Gemmatimonas sp.]|nr:hypothetical protein [Gemmatimonas sp.]